METENSIFEISWVQSLILVICALSIVFLVDRILKRFIRHLARSAIMETHEWIRAFLKNQRFIFFMTMGFYITFASIAVDWIPDLPTGIMSVFHKILSILVIVMVMMVISQISNVINSIYIKSEISRSRPIKGYLQTFEIISYFLGMVWIVAELLDKSPTLLLSGLGAITAILLLIFRDSILSLVAGIQLTMNGSIRVGDWIEMPQFNADGEVLEIALHSVKVQNWDKTITTIPAHKFLENSFKNWRGMQESGGRRIKRSIFIDVTTVRFLEASDIQEFRKVKLLEKYLDDKQKDVDSYNSLMDNVTGHAPVNKRRLTYIGTFRAYVAEYLRCHSGISSKMTFMVRQLAPSSEGLPIEIYVFTNDVRWTVYEGVQSDIFDHLLAILDVFGLKMFQNPTGQDFRALSSVAEKNFK